MQKVKPLRIKKNGSTLHQCSVWNIDMLFAGNICAGQNDVVKIFGILFLECHKHVVIWFAFQVILGDMVGGQMIE